MQQKLAAKRIPVDLLQSAGPWAAQFGTEDVEMMMQIDCTYMDTCISMVSNLTKWCLDREAKAAKQSWLP
eukprot:5475560-Prorocentrum_lima.AAC.1